MLFDEKDLRVFENTECRLYFEEILQSYYSKNYRATIVLLYSFVIYDLYMKLQTMANEGNNKAVQKVEEIKKMITEEERYSTVEKTIIQFYKDNCPLYFNRFEEDIDYLTNCRNKCAHLKVDDNSLYIPSDYHARMLICSMFDNILSVKAPFITDLFQIAQSEVERFSGTIFSVNGMTEAIKNEITNNYLKRMTDDSLKKSYKTFLKLLLITEDDNCKDNTYGLYAFTYSMTDYLIKNGKETIFSEIAKSIFDKLKLEVLEENDIKKNELIELVKNFPKLLDIIQEHKELFSYISNQVFRNPKDFGEYYKVFYAREQKSIYTYFIESSQLHNPYFSEEYYEVLHESFEFSLSEYMTIMMKAVPTWEGFSDADCVISCLLKHLEDLTANEVEVLMEIYDCNNQFYGRRRHSFDRDKMDSYISSFSNPQTENKEETQKNEDAPF